MMEMEKKRFEQICKKSAGHKNPLITTRQYEIGLTKDKTETGLFNKQDTTGKLEEKRKTLYFPDRFALKPSKTTVISRPTCSERMQMEQKPKVAMRKKSQTMK